MTDLQAEADRLADELSGSVIITVCSDDGRPRCMVSKGTSYAEAAAILLNAATGASELAVTRRGPLQ